MIYYRAKKGVVVSYWKAKPNTIDEIDSSYSPAMTKLTHDLNLPFWNRIYFTHSRSLVFFVVGETTTRLTISKKDLEIIS